LQKKDGKYIYGIIETKQNEKFGAMGVGSRGDEVTTIHFKDIAAVVSSHPIAEFDRFEEKQLKELMAVHQFVNETVMKSYTLVPMKFGNIAESDEQVKKILERAYLQFKTVLNRVQGKVELVVQAFANKQNWIQEIANTDKEIIKMKNSISADSEGVNQLDKIKIGKAIHEAIFSKEKKYGNDILNTLRNGSHNFASGKLLGEEMIFNGSFLVDKKTESEFDQRVNELSSKHEGELNFKYIGPLPPYSFVNLKLGLTDFELIDEARKILGLPCDATMSEIKSAYRILANQYHPDKNHDNTDVEEKFKAVADAYQILETFCQNYRFSFNEQVVSDTVLIHEEI